MKALELESLREALSDDKLQLTIGMIEKMSIPADRSVLKVQVKLFTEGFSIIARMGWESVGPEAGVFQFPSINDLVVVGYLNDNENEAVVMRRLTSKEDKIPLQAVDGHLVMRSLAGKTAWVTSDTGVRLSRGDTEPTERLVLGDVFKTAYSQDLAKTAAHKHIGNLGFYTAVPDNAADFLAIKAAPVDDAAMLSDLSKTEK